MIGSYRVAAATGFAGDRYEPARILAERSGPDALVFECLAERTIALAQAERMTGRSDGYDRRLLDRIRQTLPVVAAADGVIISNGGAANPRAAAAAAAELTAELGLACPVAAVTGDDVLERIDR